MEISISSCHAHCPSSRLDWSTEEVTGQTLSQKTDKELEIRNQPNILNIADTFKEYLKNVDQDRHLMSGKFGPCPEGLFSWVL